MCMVVAGVAVNKINAQCHCSPSGTDPSSPPPWYVVDTPGLLIT